MAAPGPTLHQNAVKATAGHAPGGVRDDTGLSPAKGGGEAQSDLHVCGPLGQKQNHIH